MPSFDPAVLDTIDGEVTLLGGACEGCARLHFPRQQRCPWCSGGATDIQLPRSGIVHSHTTTALPVVGAPSPVTLALVELGPDVMVQGVVATDVSIGDRVHLVPRIVPGPDG